MRHLILGGTRSGKSVYAEGLVEATGKPVTYIATARRDGMEDRIAGHDARRPPSWRVIEEPVRLAEAIGRRDGGGVTLVDCLTLWMTNLLLTDDDDLIQREIDALVNCVERYDGDLFLVSNEGGLGVVPPGELTRRYLDLAGASHQRLAQTCDRVTLVVAGLPMLLKGTAT